MKIALLASLLSAATVRADEAESSNSVAVEKPTFTPVSSIKAPFLEQFTDDWESRWKVSSAKKDDKSTEEEWAYIGKWDVEEPSVFNGMIGDKGLVIKDKAAHHAISAIFPKKIDNKDKTLVVQYEVKLQNGLECGGAYMKILQDNKALQSDEFSNASPYIIMFGPDKCGATNKVHFIFRHKNPKTGEYEEKHLKSPPAARITKTTTLYTLIISPEQTYEIQINGDSVSSGSLFEDFKPSVNPEAEIDDPEDSKPEDWVDEQKIPDPEATKPEDWDEDAPYEIVDEEATKPADWLDDEPASIPDPEAEKPEDWDDEEDGDWIPPSVPNPKCDEASGCGTWEPPMVKNPAYKGKWLAPFIDNPAYKGPWAPQKIKNPNFFEDKTPANLEPMGAIGFEIWTMQNDILFDNIYIGHSVEDANKFKNQTFDLKIKSEKAQEDAEKPKPSDDPDSPDVKFTDDPVAFLKSQFEIYRNKFELFVQLAKINPIEAAQTMPDVAGGIIGLVAIILASVISLAVAGPSKAQVKDTAKKAKDSAADAKDKVAEAVSTGAEKAQAEVNKRTTRSQAAS